MVIFLVGVLVAWSEEIWAKKRISGLGTVVVEVVTG